MNGEGTGPEALSITPPEIDDEVSRMVESHRAKTGQDYAAILMFGLWGTVDCSPEIRLYAGYRHLAERGLDGPAWLEVARLHAELGELDAAEAIVSELSVHGSPGLYSRLYREDLDVHRAHFLAGAGRFREGLAVIEELEDRHGDTALYCYVRAALLHAAGEREAAAEWYGEALSVLGRMEEEGEEDGETDMEAAREFIARQRRLAEDGGEFSGTFPMDISELRDE